ncbi:MAG: hypothetical protein ACXIUD_02690 [Mongoliitalea sp.]
MAQAVENQYIASESLQVSVRSTSKNDEYLTLTDWFASAEWIRLEDYATYNFPNFPEKKEVFNAFYCSIEHVPVKNLFKTLLTLGGLPGMLIEYQKEQNQFVFRLYKSQEATLLAKLQWMERYIAKELRFKQILTKLITNEKRYQAEERLLRTELF